MVRKLFALLAIAVWTASVSSSVQAQTEIKIGSWNIEHLGFPDSRFGDAKGIAQDPDDLAAHIKSAGLDVIALQEIGDTSDPGRKNSTLDEMMTALNVGGQDWTYEIHANKTQSDKTQLTAVAWNRKKVNKVGSTFRIPVKDNPDDPFNAWDRNPSAIKFTAGEGKTDFVVISLHMKAGAGNQEKNQRAEEAKVLLNELGVIKSLFKEEDVILLGDTNAVEKDEAALKLFRDAGYVDLNEAGVTTVPWGDRPFDHIFLKKDREPFTGATMQVIPTNNEDQRIKLSDHLLVHATIKIVDDNDENPPFGTTPVTPEPKKGPQDGSEIITSSAVRILALLPDPNGPDAGNESVTVSNSNAGDASLEGWSIKDKNNNSMALSGKIPGNGTLSIRLTGSVSLNQNGDEVRLINPSGEVVHKVTYTQTQVKRGKFITFSN